MFLGHKEEAVWLVALNTRYGGEQNTDQYLRLKKKKK